MNLEKQKVRNEEKVHRFLYRSTPKILVFNDYSSL